MFLCVLRHLNRFGFCDVPAENARDTLTLVVNAQHDVRRFGDRKLEKLHQGMHDEILGRVVSVMKDDDIAGGFLQPGGGRQVPLLGRCLQRVSHGWRVKISKVGARHQWTPPGCKAVASLHRAETLAPKPPANSGVPPLLWACGAGTDRALQNRARRYTRAPCSNP